MVTEREVALDNTSKVALKLAYERGSTPWIRNEALRIINAGNSKEDVLEYFRQLGMAPGNVTTLSREIDDALRQSSTVFVRQPVDTAPQPLPLWVVVALVLAMVGVAVVVALSGMWYIQLHMLH